MYCSIANGKNCEKIPETSKTEANRLRSARRNARILAHQHQIDPFMYKADLTFKTFVELERFRNRIKEFAKADWHAVVFIEQAVGSTNYHYHAVLRPTEALNQMYTICHNSPRHTKYSTKQEYFKSSFRSLVQLAITLRKDQNSSFFSSKIDLKFESIKPHMVKGLFCYITKSNKQHLKNNILQKQGSREYFTIGKPFSLPTVELAKVTDEEQLQRAWRLVAAQPLLVARFMSGELVHKDMLDRRFRWRCREYLSYQSYVERKATNKPPENRSKSPYTRLSDDIAEYRAWNRIEAL